MSLFTDWSLFIIMIFYSGLSVCTFIVNCVVISQFIDITKVFLLFSAYDFDGPTYFIPQPHNVTFHVGQTATLLCSVENLGNKTVSNNTFLFFIFIV
jgi:hypothetical protein